MNEGLWLIFILALWITAILLFRNLKMEFFKFLVGSLGIFAIGMIFFRDPIENDFLYLINSILAFISDKSDMFEVMKNYSIVNFYVDGSILSMSINYQCSGVIESLIFTSLVIFFPFVKSFKKVLVVLVGNIYLIFINILRILMIIVLTRQFGLESYDFIHMVLGRIFFFVFTVLLYYIVFTKNQLKGQKVGEIK